MREATIDEPGLSWDAFSLAAHRLLQELSRILQRFFLAVEQAFHVLYEPLEGPSPSETLHTTGSFKRVRKDAQRLLPRSLSPVPPNRKHKQKLQKKARKVRR